MIRTDLTPYLGVKRVDAISMTRGEYNTYRGWDIPENEDPLDEGYLVEYVVSPGKPNHPNHPYYISWSPKEAFDESHRVLGEMSFSAALNALKMGRLIARKGWNGKGMYLWLLEETIVPRPWVKDERLLECYGDKDELKCLGSIRMRTADGSVLTGWLASQSDMLAEDWTVVE